MSTGAGPSPQFREKRPRNDGSTRLKKSWDMVEINAPGAWNTQTNASDVIVAVIDTGVDFTHPDLQANLSPLGSQSGQVPVGTVETVLTPATGKSLRARQARSRNRCTA